MTKTQTRTETQTHIATINEAVKKIWFCFNFVQMALQTHPLCSTCRVEFNDAQTTKAFSPCVEAGQDDYTKGIRSPGYTVVLDIVQLAWK